MRIVPMTNENISTLKKNMLEKILTKAFSIEGVADNFNGALYVEMLGGSFESVKEAFDSIPYPGMTQGIIKSLCNTLDTKVDLYAQKMGYNLYYSTEEDDETKTDDDLLFENADTELEKGDDKDINTESFDSSSSATSSIADTIQEMVNDLASKHTEEIRNLSKTILKLEKANQEMLLQEKKEEDGEFIENIDEPEEKEENNDTDNNNNGSEDSEPEEDPFDNNGTGTEEGSDPFGDDNSENTQDNGSDPFEDNEESNNEKDTNEEGSEDKGSSGDLDANPFDSNEGDASFESMDNYGFINGRIIGTNNRASLLSELKVGNIVSYAKYYANEALQEAMNKAYATESQEDLTTALNTFQKVSKRLAHSVANTLAVATVIGVPVDITPIRYPEL